MATNPIGTSGSVRSESSRPESSVREPAALASFDSSTSASKFSASTGESLTTHSGAGAVSGSVRRARHSVQNPSPSRRARPETTHARARSLRGWYRGRVAAPSVCAPVFDALGERFLRLIEAVSRDDRARAADLPSPNSRSCPSWRMPAAVSPIARSASLASAIASRRVRSRRVPRRCTATARVAHAVRIRTTAASGDDSERPLERLAGGRDRRSGDVAESNDVHGRSAFGWKDRHRARGHEVSTSGPHRSSRRRRPSTRRVGPARRRGRPDSRDSSRSARRSSAQRFVW